MPAEPAQAHCHEDEEEGRCNEQRGWWVPHAGEVRQLHGCHDLAPPAMPAVAPERGLLDRGQLLAVLVPRAKTGAKTVRRLGGTCRSPSARFKPQNKKALADTMRDTMFDDGNTHGTY